MKTFPLLLSKTVVIAITTVLFLIDYGQNSDSSSNNPLNIQRVYSPIKLDGLSNESAWDSVKSLPMITRSPDKESKPKSNMI